MTEVVRSCDLSPTLRNEQEDVLPLPNATGFLSNSLAVALPYDAATLASTLCDTNLRMIQMKCDTARPSCKNCIEHGEACNYQRETKPRQVSLDSSRVRDVAYRNFLLRPTHAVIQGLQDQVAELQRLLEAQQKESRLLERKTREPSVNGRDAVSPIRMKPPPARAPSGTSEVGVDGSLTEYRRGSTEKPLLERNGSALQGSPLSTLKRTFRYSLCIHALTRLQLSLSRAKEILPNQNKTTCKSDFKLLNCVLMSVEQAWNRSLLDISILRCDMCATINRGRRRRDPIRS